MLRHASAPRTVLLTSALLFSLAYAATATAGRPGKSPNSPPTITGAPATTALGGTRYDFTPTASDPEGDKLSFRASGKPSWATFNQTTGRLTGTPSLGDVGTSSTVSIRVSDGRSTVYLPTFVVTVDWATQPNRAPTISGTPAAAVTAGSAYTFQPVAADADGDVLSFNISGKPAWATFDGRTGALTGTPTTAGTYTGITISVTDGKAVNSLPAFGVTVSPPPELSANHSPSIAGAPVTTAVAGRPYSFRPTANDVDGDPLTFTVSGKPTWATFDATTGTLFGTPTDANVGTYSNVVIGVSDGKLASTLAAFAINVAPAPTKSVTLNWTAPTQNVDGSALSDLAGFEVSYGSTSRQYTYTVRLVGAGSNSIAVEGLAPGTWYFAIKSYNTAGVASDYSGEVVATL